jgi:hypothetical protein
VSEGGSGVVANYNLYYDSLIYQYCMPHHEWPFLSIIKFDVLNIICEKRTRAKILSE